MDDDVAVPADVCVDMDDDVAADTADDADMYNDMADNVAADMATGADVGAYVDVDVADGMASDDDVAADMDADVIMEAHFPETAQFGFLTGSAQFGFFYWIGPVARFWPNYYSSVYNG